MRSLDFCIIRNASHTYKVSCRKKGEWWKRRRFFVCAASFHLFSPACRMRDYRGPGHKPSVPMLHPERRIPQSKGMVVTEDPQLKAIVYSRSGSHAYAVLCITEKRASNVTFMTWINFSSMQAEIFDIPLLSILLLGLQEPNLNKFTLNKSKCCHFWRTNLNDLTTVFK